MRRGESGLILDWQPVFWKIVTAKLVQIIRERSLAPIAAEAAKKAKSAKEQAHAGKSHSARQQQSRAAKKAAEKAESAKEHILSRQDSPAVEEEPKAS